MLAQISMASRAALYDRVLVCVHTRMLMSASLAPLHVSGFGRGGGACGHASVRFWPVHLPPHWAFRGWKSWDGACLKPVGDSLKAALLGLPCPAM